MITSDKPDFNTLTLFLLAPLVYACVIIFVPVMIAYRIIEAVVKG